MPLSAFDLLGPVLTTLLSTHAGSLGRLTVDDACAGQGVPLEANSLAQGGVHLLPRPIQAPAAKVVVDGLITNDKFCFTRRSRLKLRPKRRGYPSRKGVRRGGIDETELDRSTHDGRPRRRRPSLGPGLCVPPPLGGTQGKHERGGS